MKEETVLHRYITLITAQPSTKIRFPCEFTVVLLLFRTMIPKSWSAELSPLEMVEGSLPENV
jgi:hypothetical protein